MVKVSPVIEGGAYPAKAAVGESFPIRAQVFREGHDAVNASVVLTNPDGQETASCRCTRPPRSASTGGRPRSRSDTRGRVDVPGRGLERPVGDLGAQRRDQDPGRHRRQPGLHRGQGPVHAPRPSGPSGRRRPRPPPCCAARPRAWTPASRSRTGCEVVLADDVRGAMASVRPARAGLPHPGLPDLRRPAGARCSPPGTSSSPAPRVRRVRRGDRDLDLRHLRLLARAARGGGGDGLRRGLPPADPPDRHARSARARTTRCSPGPGRSRLAVGDRQRRGRARRHPSRPGRLRRLRPVRGQGQVARPGGRDGLRAAGLPGPPVGHRAPGVVLQAGRRLHRVRGEPAEEVPGHLPDQLRQRPGRHLPRVRCAS